MIVVISNRKLEGTLDGKPKPYSFLGKDMGDTGNVYGKAHLVSRKGADGKVKKDSKGRAIKDKRLTLFSEQDKSQLFDEITDKIKAGNAELNRPWVVFLHGNNQTTAKNIGKAADIEKQHHVNVIAFSWASQPYTGDDDKLLKALKKEAAKKLVRALGGTTIVSNLLSTGYQMAEGFWRNYTLARMNAEASAADFSRALKAINQQLLSKAGSKFKLSFLCHSLGHHLLQKTLTKHTFPIKFSNIMLHQGDTDAPDHAKWVKKLHGKCRDIYITTNQYDWVLLASNFYNRVERLGQTKQYYGCKKCRYVDFSDAAYTSAENEHEFFRLKPQQKGFSYTNEEIHRFIGKVVRSEINTLTKKSGFTERVKNVYELSTYIDPIDDEISER